MINKIVPFFLKKYSIKNLDGNDFILFDTIKTVVIFIWKTIKKEKRYFVRFVHLWLFYKSICNIINNKEFSRQPVFYCHFIDKNLQNTEYLIKSNNKGSTTS